VDVERFARDLPALFDEFPRSEHPRDRRFARILDEVPGLARENNLALINLAAACRDPGEAYVELGTFRGTSLISAMLGNEGVFVALDDFSFREASRELLEENLRRFDLGHARIIEGDAFETLRGGALDGVRAGVWYYDAAHTYEQQLDGLVLAEPYLADRALLIVDDAVWDFVGRAVADYVEREPRARRLFDIPGDDDGNSPWWCGVSVLAWERS
jgi:predicted O-methyltransferase YrrM